MIQQLPQTPSLHYDQNQPHIRDGWTGKKLPAAHDLDGGWHQQGYTQQPLLYLAQQETASQSYYDTLLHLTHYSRHHLIHLTSALKRLVDIDSLYPTSRLDYTY